MQKDPAQRFASAMEMARALPPRARATPAPLAPHEGYTTRTRLPLSRLPAVAVRLRPRERHLPGRVERAAHAGRDRAAPLEAIRARGRVGHAPERRAPVQSPDAAPPARVLVLDAPHGSTMPSHDLPMLDPPASRRGGARRAPDRGVGGRGPRPRCARRPGFCSGSRSRDPM